MYGGSLMSMSARFVGFRSTSGDPPLRENGPAQSRDDIGLRAPMATVSCPRLLASTAAFVARFQAGLRVPAAGLLRPYLLAATNE
jgi:hypothetical protein